MGTVIAGAIRQAFGRLWTRGSRSAGSARPAPPPHASTARTTDAEPRTTDAEPRTPPVRTRTAAPGETRRISAATWRRSPGETRSPALGEDYPGDFQGSPKLVYAPHEGRLPDPGEVVWTWVPYEEDHRLGKDRPALIIGRDGQWLLGLGLSSQDHDGDADQEAREGRYWVDIGRGAWDQGNRASEVRVNRIIRVHPGRIRRVAGRLDRRRFDLVAAAVRQHTRTG